MVPGGNGKELVGVYPIGRSPGLYSVLGVPRSGTSVPGSTSGMGGFPVGGGIRLEGNSRYTRVDRGVYARACTYSIRIPVPWYLYPTRYLHLPRVTLPYRLL